MQSPAHPEIAARQLRGSAPNERHTCFKYVAPQVVLEKALADLGGEMLSQKSVYYSEERMYWAMTGYIAHSQMRVYIHLRWLQQESGAQVRDYPRRR
jgi:hypothetical protein